MKIAIMTLRPSKNYGGIMQAWALQQVLKSAGHEPITMDRQTNAKSPVYNAARLSYRTLKKIMGKRKEPINFERHLPNILQHTQAFIEQHMNMSEPLDSTAKLKAHFDREKYAAVIVGSDQTWRPKYTPNIDNFFLDFLQNHDIKRIAYAASFGVDNWEFTEEQTQRCALLAKQFDAISVREDSGVGLCKKYFGVEATHVLDPTLLLEKQTYEALYEGKDIPLRKGVYTYILDQAEWKEQTVKLTMQMLGKPQYNNQPKKQLTDSYSGNLNDYKLPCLVSWIKGFADADFVITDSFHGTVFSIIFNKPFISLVNRGRGASRFYSIADKLGLSERLMTSFDRKVIEDVVKVPINYFEVNKKLMTLRKESKIFLSEAINTLV